MSRLNLASEAVRPSMKGRALFAGPPGSGKTKTALAVATVLAEGGLILGIDTEDREMLTYAVSPDNPTGFEFKHLPWQEPYDLVDLTDTIKQAGQDFAVIVIDSMYHFWHKSGGILDGVDGRFGGWKGARTVIQDFYTAVKNSPAHVLLCARSKVEYVQEEVIDQGRRKQVVKKLGMGVQFDGGLESEVQVFIEMDMDHVASISKSRSDAVPVGKVYPANHERDFASQYAEWLRAGEPFADLEEQARIDQARANLDPNQKHVLWQLWQRHALPSPENMTATHVAIADRLIEQVKEGPKAKAGAGNVSGQAAALREAAAKQAQAAQDGPAAPGEGTGAAESPNVTETAASGPQEPAGEVAPAAESFPESQGDPFTSEPGKTEAKKAPMTARRKALLAEAEKQFGDEYDSVLSKAADGTPFESISTDDLHGLLFPKAS